MLNIDEGQNSDWIKQARDILFSYSSAWKKLQKEFNIKLDRKLMAFMEGEGITPDSSYEDMKKAYEKFI